MTGLSRAQVARRLSQYQQTGVVRERPYRRNQFPSRYTSDDIELLAAVDEAPQSLSGPATQKILYREYHEYGDQRYQRLAAMSMPHIYNLRQRRAYRDKRIQYQKTRPGQVAIGERRRPDPQGQPGYLRVDTVHPGELDGIQGVYPINAVDAVTPWQVVGATAPISEAWLIPVLEAMLHQFPFRILGFHADNGSEFIHHTVARLLNQLLVEQTQSRPRHSNANGLVEAQQGAVIRKHLGYSPIRSEHAEVVEDFYERYFNPHLNFPRPGGGPEIRTSAKGKQRRV
ncbi:MAG: integrase catalytic domain-containing protein [Bryobacteraceae bacterium]